MKLILSIFDLRNRLRHRGPPFGRYPLFLFAEYSPYICNNATAWPIVLILFSIRPDYMFFYNK